MTYSEDYKTRANYLLKEAKKHSKFDNKYYCNFKGIEDLIGAGAKIISLNEKEFGKLYKHEVVYKDYRFISSTDDKIIFTIIGSLVPRY